MGKRQHYNQKFKEETVKYIQQYSKSLPDISGELNIPVNTLQSWVNKYRQFPDEPFVGSGNLREQEQKFKDLENQIRELEEENAILKKAMHFFSKDRK
jgi:transposase